MIYEDKEFIYNAENGELSYKQMSYPNVRSAHRCSTTPNGHGYLYASHHRKGLTGQHRIAWYLVHGYWPKEVDHINHKRTDNRLCNLREVSHTTNMRNKSLDRRNRSGISGVLFNESTELWSVLISGDKYRHEVGPFDDFFEACCVRKSAEHQIGYHENHGRVL